MIYYDAMKTAENFSQIPKSDRVAILREAIKKTNTDVRSITAMPNAPHFLRQILTGEAGWDWIVVVVPSQIAAFALLALLRDWQIDKPFPTETKTFLKHMTTGLTDEEVVSVFS